MVWRGFERFSEVCRGFQRFFKGPLRDPLRVPFSSQSWGSAFGLRLHSKMQCFKTRVLGRRLPNGKPQERLRFRALRCKTLAFKKRIAIVFCDLKTSLGALAFRLLAFKKRGVLRLRF